MSRKTQIFGVGMVFAILVVGSAGVAAMGNEQKEVQVAVAGESTSSLTESAIVTEGVPTQMETGYMNSMTLTEGVPKTVELYVDSDPSTVQVDSYQSTGKTVTLLYNGDHVTVAGGTDKVSYDATNDVVYIHFENLDFEGNDFLTA